MRDERLKRPKLDLIKVKLRLLLEDGQLSWYITGDMIEIGSFLSTYSIFYNSKMTYPSNQRLLRIYESNKRFLLLRRMRWPPLVRQQADMLITLLQ